MATTKNIYKQQKSTTKGSVLDVNDPRSLNRVRVYIPEIMDLPSSAAFGKWCLCTLPEVPDVDDIVLVSYENDDIRNPIVIGNITKALQGGSANSYTVFDASTASTNQTFIALIARILNINECGKEYPGDEQYGVWLQHDPEYEVVDKKTGKKHFEGVSLGLLGWHEDNARELFTKIKAADESNWVACGCNDLSRGIDKTWDDYTFGLVKDKPPMKALQISEVGKKIQNEIQIEYISSYIETAVSIGITDIKCIMYYCDFANQACNAAKEVVAVLNQSSINSLDTFHNAIMARSGWPTDTEANKNRRKRTYEKIIEMELAGEFDQFTVSNSEGIELMWPAPGYPTIAYGYGNKDKATYGSWHPGIDINSTGKTAAAEIWNQPAVACCDGTVMTGWDSGGGNFVRIQRNGIEQFYCYYFHFNSIASGLKTGDTVKTGDIVGYIGNTGGNSKGSGGHLHFEIRKGGTAGGDRDEKNHGNIVDPTEYLLPDGIVPKTSTEKKSITSWPKQTGAQMNVDVEEKDDVNNSIVYLRDGAMYAKNYDIVVDGETKAGPEVIVVNEYYPIAPTYNPQSLLPIVQQKYKELKAAGQAWKYKYKKQWEITNGFVSFDEQNIRHSNVILLGSDYAKKHSTQAGYCENQTGFTVDIYSTDIRDWGDPLQRNTDDDVLSGNECAEQNGTTEQLEWLMDNAHKYGFIMRYPNGATEQETEDFENVTGHPYSPWKWRYVGTELATYIRGTEKHYEWTLDEVTHIYPYTSVQPAEINRPVSRDVVVTGLVSQDHARVCVQIYASDETTPKTGELKAYVDKEKIEDKYKWSCELFTPSGEILQLSYGDYIVITTRIGRLQPDIAKIQV